MPTITIKPLEVEGSRFKYAKATCSGTSCNQWQIIEEAYTIIQTAEDHIRSEHPKGFIATANGQWKVSSR